VRVLERRRELDLPAEPLGAEPANGSDRRHRLPRPHGPTTGTPVDSRPGTRYLRAHP
jgi:hypothetical protein